MIAYAKMSLFDAPKNAIIAHGCNGQGVWGSGIAATFAQRYKRAYQEYSTFCNEGQEYNFPVVGRSFISFDQGHWIGCLITSNSYGVNKDSKKLIKVNTAIALTDFCRKLERKFEGGELTVYSNKFNSGLFAVPWEDSAFILEAVLKHFKRIKWIVCDPDLKD